MIQNLIFPLRLVSAYKFILLYLYFYFFASINIIIIETIILVSLTLNTFVSRNHLWTTTESSVTATYCYWPL